MTEQRLTVVSHPLIQHKLGYLRDKETPTVHFRKLANEITLLLTYEATKDMPTEGAEVETPLERMTVQRISGKKVAVCPVLRAGVAQVVFLVLFSYAFFFEGYTGLTVTVGAIVTLFVLMQVTGRVKWDEVVLPGLPQRQPGQ